MILKNKKVLIIGVASKRSIAASIAQVFSDNGAEIALTYQNEKLKSRVEDIASGLSGNSIIYPCDLAKDEDICNLKKFIPVFKCLAIIFAFGCICPKRAFKWRFC